jgi:hypothetical protein
MAAEIEMAIDAGSGACPFLVQNEGKPVYDWDKSWATACTPAGVPDALFHDLRRTALTNMIEAGFSEKESHGDQWAQDSRRVRPLPHRQRQTMEREHR